MTRLSEAHTEELNSSRIDSALIESRGYMTVGPEWREQLAAMNCPAWAMRDESAFPALVLPMYRPGTGEYIGFQFKPAAPQPRPGTDKLVKYVSPKGMGNRLDVHPACLDRVADVNQPLWITEGVKKSDALASRDQAVVTLTGVWNWRNQEGTLGDWEDIPLKGRVIVVCFDADAAVNPQVRNAMVRLVGWLRSRGASKAYYCPVPEKVGETAVKGVDDFLAAGGTIQQLHSGSSLQAPEAPSSRDAAFSDAFLTDTVCEETLQGRYLFAQGLGWMRYDGSRWCETTDAGVVEEIRLWAKARWEDVVEEYKRDQSRDVKAKMEGWRQVLTNARLKALASLARGPLLTHADRFDAHPDLLNCPNGVVDLRTGELLEPDPAYLMTKCTGVPYDPAASSPDFDQALEALPADVRGWYQVRIGQAFTGHMPPDDLLIVQQGGGENGKSTLAVPISRAAGDYQTLVSHRVILGRADQHPTELMDLMGVRFALMEETPEARQLSVQQLKQVVGTPTIKARKIRQDSVEFPATHALFINTNFAPVVVETDHATWRRLAMVRFPYTFRKRPGDVRGPDDRLGDPALRERLSAGDGGAMAALTWAVHGAVSWYSAGRVFGPLPERVQADTREWKGKGDLIQSWLEERCQFSPDASELVADLFQSFSQWLVENKHSPWTQRLFTDRFAGHDDVRENHVVHERRKVGGTMVRRWAGVRVVPHAPQMQYDPVYTQSMVEG